MSTDCSIQNAHHKPSYVRPVAAQVSLSAALQSNCPAVQLPCSSCASDPLLRHVHHEYSHILFILFIFIFYNSNPSVPNAVGTLCMSWWASLSTSPVHGRRGWWCDATRQTPPTLDPTPKSNVYKQEKKKKKKVFVPSGLICPSANRIDRAGPFPRHGPIRPCRPPAPWVPAQCVRLVKVGYACITWRRSCSAGDTLRRAHDRATKHENYSAKSKSASRSLASSVSIL